VARNELECATFFLTAAGSGDAGPDILRPATSRKTWHCRDAVRIDVAETGPLSNPPVSIVTAFRKIVQQFPDQIALGLYNRNCGSKFTGNVACQ